MITFLRIERILRLRNQVLNNSAEHHAFSNPTLVPLRRWLDTTPENSLLAPSKCFRFRWGQLDTKDPLSSKWRGM